MCLSVVWGTYHFKEDDQGTFPEKVALEQASEKGKREEYGAVSRKRNVVDQNPWGWTSLKWSRARHESQCRRSPVTVGERKQVIVSCRDVAELFIPKLAIGMRSQHASELVQVWNPGIFSPKN